MLNPEQFWARLFHMLNPEPNPSWCDSIHKNGVGVCVCNKKNVTQFWDCLVHALISSKCYPIVFERQGNVRILEKGYIGKISMIVVWTCG